MPICGSRRLIHFHNGGGFCLWIFKQKCWERVSVNQRLKPFATSQEIIFDYRVAHYRWSAPGHEPLALEIFTKDEWLCYLPMSVPYIQDECVCCKALSISFPCQFAMTLRFAPSARSVLLPRAGWKFLRMHPCEFYANGLMTFDGSPSFCWASKAMTIWCRPAILQHMIKKYGTLCQASSSA